MNESCVQSMRCTCRCIESGAAGIRAVAPAHLPHPRVAGRRIMEPPLCTRPSVFSPGFFHRLATRRAAGGAPFVDRIRVGVRSPRCETIPFGSHARGPFANQRATRSRSSTQPPPPNKRRAADYRSSARKSCPTAVSPLFLRLPASRAPSKHPLSLSLSRRCYRR